MSEQKVPEHPFYKDQTNWRDADFFHDWTWPDQYSKKGRPRSVKWGRILHVVTRGIHARILGRDKYGAPYSPVYRSRNYNTAKQTASRLRNKYRPLLPDGEWRLKIVKKKDDELKCFFWMILLSYSPPEDLREIQFTWGLNAHWMNEMIKLDEQRKAKELDPSLAAFENEYEAELLEKIKYLR